VLTANNTYTGLTSVIAGILQLGNGSTTGTVAGPVQDNSSLVFNRSDAFTFSGAILGTGSVVQNGTGEVVLTAENAYTGGTTVNHGQLQIGNGGTTGSVTGNIVNNNVLSFDHSNDITFAGAISGAGGVFQNGTGTLVLTGAETNTGGT